MMIKLTYDEGIKVEVGVRDQLFIILVIGDSPHFKF